MSKGKIIYGAPGRLPYATEEEWLTFFNCKEMAYQDPPKLPIPDGLLVFTDLEPSDLSEAEWSAWQEYEYMPASDAAQAVRNM